MKENKTPVVPVATPQVAVEQPKQSNFLVILLSTLLLLSVLIAGFFAYQTQKLVKELTLLRTEPTPIATSESVVFPELTFEQDKTIDPTANWKTYEMNRIDFKYPQNYFVEPQSSKSNVTIFNKNSGTDRYYIGISEIKGSLQQLVQTGAINKDQLTDVKILFPEKGFYAVKELKGTALPSDVSETIYLIDQVNSYIEIRFWNNTDTLNTEYELFRKNIELILSSVSFKG